VFDRRWTGCIWELAPLGHERSSWCGTFSSQTCLTWPDTSTTPCPRAGPEVHGEW